MEKPGDRIRVVTKDDMFEGVLMPQAGTTLVLKLPNGYNIGIERTKIKNIEVLKKYAPSKTRPQEIKHRRDLPTISVLHTGGTIASKVDYLTGGTSAKFSPEELVGLFPEIKEIANIRSRLVANLMSENMRFAHYNMIAREIEKEIKEGVQGIIVTQGTDTLHYTSSALSFMLEDLPIPVVLVGAQRSSDRPSSDSAINFLSAVHFAINSDFAGVALCMHESMDDRICHVIDGTKARKMHTSRRDAFRPINSPALARIDFERRSIEFISGNYKRKNQQGKLKVSYFKENLRVGILKCHPNMYASQFLAYLGFDGLVLELTGLGQGPIVVFDDITKEHDNIREAIADLVKKGTIIVAAPQAIYGRLQMNVYSEGRKMQDLGVLGNYCDMTPETAFIKLAWLLSNHKKEEIVDLICENLAGEISKRTPEQGFLE